MIKRTRLTDVTRLLVDTAMSRRKADLMIRGGAIVNVDSKELLEDVDQIASISKLMSLRTIILI